jgi:hypothetical protein
MWTKTPQSKLVPILTVDKAMDMFSRDATTTLREQRKVKGHNEVARLKALLLNHEWERAMAQPP